MNLIKIFLLTFLALLSAHISMAQMSFAIAQVYFQGEKVKKVSLADDGTVWCIKGINNRGVGRVSGMGITTDLTPLYQAFSPAVFNDIAAYDLNTSFIGTQGDYILRFQNGTLLRQAAAANVGSAIINSIAVNKGLNENNTGNIPHKSILASGDSGYLGKSDSLFNQYRNYTDHYPTENSVYIRNETIRNRTLTYNLFYSEYDHWSTSNELLTDNQYTTIGNYFHEVINTAIGTDNIYPEPSYLNDGFSAFLGTDTGVIKMSFDHFYLPKHYIKDRVIYKLAEINPFYYASSIRINNRDGINFYLKTIILAGTDNGLYYGNFYSALQGEQTNNFLQVNVLAGLRVYDIKADYTCDNVFWAATDQGLFKIYLKWGKRKEFNVPKPLYFLNTDYGFKDTVKLCKLPEIKLSDYDLRSFDRSKLALQWYRNDTLIKGAYTDTLSTSKPGRYNLVTNFLCDGNVVDTSRYLTIIKLQIPEVTFNYPDTLRICSDSAWVLKAGYNAGFHYQWYKNGNPVLNDTSYSHAVLDSGSYSLHIINCPGDTVTTKAVFVAVITLKIPSIIQDKHEYCAGSSAVLTVAAPADYRIKWYLNTTELPHFAGEQHIRIQQAGTYTCSFEKPGFSCKSLSRPVKILFVPFTPVTILASESGPYCPGSTIRLTAEVQSEIPVHYLWSTGDTTKSITVSGSGQFGVSAGIISSCMSAAEIAIKYEPDLSFSLGKDTALCLDRDHPFILSAPAGFTRYLWNQVETGLNTFPVNVAGTITLTAYTFQNCAFTSTVHVYDACKLSALVFPTVFSPDGNGLNDVFNVKHMELFPDNDMHIFNRFGNQVFSCTGYGVNGRIWDGRSLPEGTYYYIFRVRSTGQNPMVFKGYVTLMRSGRL